MRVAAKCMPAFYGECKVADGQWAVVKQLDRHDLAALEEAIPEWSASGEDGAFGASDATFESA